MWDGVTDCSDHEAERKGQHSQTWKSQLASEDFMGFAKYSPRHLGTPWFVWAAVFLENQQGFIQVSFLLSTIQDYSFEW